jgi:ribose transport system substrate-binding protein
MRKLALMVIAVAVLSGCRPATGKITLAFISNNPHEFWTIARRGTEKAGRDFPDIAVEFYMPAYGTAAEQHQIIEALVAKGARGIAISPNQAVHQKRVLDEIIPGHVAFLTQDSDLPPGSRRLCYIGTDNVAAGYAVGRLAREALGDRGGKVMIYVGNLDAQNAQERRQGVIAALAGLKESEAKSARAVAVASESHITGLDGKYEVLGTMTDEVSTDKCKRNVENTLSKYPDVGCLIGLWAYNPPAIVEGIRSAGKLGRIPIIGFDENEETLQGIVEGYVYATVVQNPYLFGYKSMEILRYYALNHRLPDYVPLDRLYYVRHRVIRCKDRVRPGQLFDEDVEEFRTDLRKKKAGQA